MTLIAVILSICVMSVNLWQQPIEKPRIVVYKSARKLEFYSDQKLLRTYRIGLGFSPVPDKQREGDGFTTMDTLPLRKAFAASSGANMVALISGE